MATADLQDRSGDEQRAESADGENCGRREGAEDITRRKHDGHISAGQGEAEEEDETENAGHLEPWRQCREAAQDVREGVPRFEGDDQQREEEQKEEVGELQPHAF